MLWLVLTRTGPMGQWGNRDLCHPRDPVRLGVVIATVEPVDFAIVLCIGGFLFSTVVAWPIAVFVAELGTRPVVARICAEFPHVSAPEGSGCLCVLGHSSPFRP